MAQQPLVKIRLNGKGGRYRFVFGQYNHKLVLGPDGGWTLFRSRRDPPLDLECGIESGDFLSLADAVHYAIEAGTEDES